VRLHKSRVHNKGDVNLSLITRNTSLLQMGPPRALPGLEVVKVESVKEGTQYESGEFQDPLSLPQGRPV